MNSQIQELLKIPQYEQRSPEWFNQRKDKLTSSDAASVLGMNKYKDYKTVLFEKCGIKSDFVGNEATLHGQKYEQTAIDKYCEIFGKKNFDFGLIEYTSVYTDNKYPWLAGSPDGICQNLDDPDAPATLLEVKCPYRRKIVEGYCPECYFPQVQLNMYITDLYVADFIEFVPTETMNVVRMYRDEKWLEWALPILDGFWKEVEHYRSVGIDKHPNYMRSLNI